MKLKPKQLEALYAERTTLQQRLFAIDDELRAHERICTAERLARPRKPIAPPREPINNPDVAIVRQYARDNWEGAQVFNGRRANDRRVKIWVGLNKAQFDMHARALQPLLPAGCKIVRASPPTGRNAYGCLAVVMPL